VKSLRTFAVLPLALSSAGFCLEPAHQQATYTLKATPETAAWSYYDLKAVPVLRVKAGDTIKIPTPSAWTSAEGERAIVYVKPLESPVRYPPLARETRMTGTAVIKLTIAVDGTALSTESSEGDKNTVAFEVLKDDAERIVKAWTFGCAGGSPNGPFEHTIKFIYKQEDSFTAPGLRVEMNLPGEVTITTSSVQCGHCPPVKPSKKGSN